MQTIALGGTGRETTRLGFGCSSIMGSLNRKDSMRILEAAFDAGLRHFDVAPSYGFGEAEGCLGEFLARHAGQVTVTTKFGIPAEPKGSLKSAARSLARPLIKLLPGLKKRMQAAAGSLTPAVQRETFSAQRAQASLEHSLTALGLERIDLWLLHEAEAEDLADDGLLRMLEDAVAAGKIGAFGVGSHRDKIAKLLAERAGYCPVLQYEWSVLDPLIPPGSSFRLHHRALTENFRALHEALQQDAERCVRWSEHCGADLSQAEVLARLMLKAALVCNAESVILFSSKSSKHIENNVRLVEDDQAGEQALRLYALTRAEAMQGS